MRSAVRSRRRPRRVGPECAAPAHSVDCGPARLRPERGPNWPSRLYSFRERGSARACCSISAGCSEPVAVRRRRGAVGPREPSAGARRRGRHGRLRRRVRAPRLEGKLCCQVEQGYRLVRAQPERRFGCDRGEIGGQTAREHLPGQNTAQRDKHEGAEAPGRNGLRCHGRGPRRERAERRSPRPRSHRFARNPSPGGPKHEVQRSADEAPPLPVDLD